MPCDADYMNPSFDELNLSKVACLLNELDGVKIDPRWWQGYHPEIYSKKFDRDELVKRLCGRLQNVDVSKCSLEMQIWWRDHQAADKERVRREIESQKTAEDKASALSKLTDYERKLLGLQ